MDKWHNFSLGNMTITCNTVLNLAVEQNKLQCTAYVDKNMA